MSKKYKVPQGRLLPDKSCQWQGDITVSKGWYDRMIKLNQHKLTLNNN
jgi:hypothetical protein